MTEGTKGVLDFRNLMLKDDAELRPFWVVPAGDGRILLETSSPFYEQAQDFLVAIAEPMSRQEHFHEYQLTSYALYGAASIGMDAKEIIRTLHLFSENKVPSQVLKMIRKCTKSYGKARLVLQSGKYFVQTRSKAVMESFLQDLEIAHARVQVLEEELNTLMAQTEEKGVSKRPKLCFSFQVNRDDVELVKSRAMKSKYPLAEEYDFRNDTVNPSICLDLKPGTKIRSYQKLALERMFTNGCARSGVIVLPCGAGKSLVGVTAACTIRKPVLCLCTSAVSVEQWRYQFALWSTMKPENIARFVATSSTTKSFIGDVAISTYSMICHSGDRATETKKLLDDVGSREWGLLLLDEVHVVPANVFRKVISLINSHCKLGLTATLLREDEKIEDINFLIGPKLYEANWIDLQKQGYLANVQCIDVWCPMTKESYQEYLWQDARERRLLYTANRIKFLVCQRLVSYHESRGDKIIVFSDNIGTLEEYAGVLDRDYIQGSTSQMDRLNMVKNFQRTSAGSTILLSRVGDTSLDIPDASVLIQVSSDYGSRRQEAQRLGRILRPKKRGKHSSNAFFYSLVSKDTQEMCYSSKRRQFLIDQGYSFKVITSRNDTESSEVELDAVEELLGDVLAVGKPQSTWAVDECSN